MLGLLTYFALIGFLYWKGWFLAGAIILFLTALNGMGAAFRSVRDPDWYWRKRKAEIGVTAHEAFFGPSPETLREGIERLLLVKVVTSSLLVALSMLFAFKAGVFG